MDSSIDLCELIIGSTDQKSCLNGIRKLIAHVTSSNSMFFLNNFQNIGKVIEKCIIGSN